MKKQEIYGGITAAIGGILLALAPYNLFLVPLAYVFFLISAILLTLWSIRLKYKGILIMNVTYVVVDLVGFYTWITKAISGF